MSAMHWLESGPGASLAKRREELGLSAQEAAAQLKVKPEVIRQLEQQSWDPKTAATFIRGYLRNYARLLKIDEQDVLSQFEPLLGQLPHQSSMQSFSRKTTRDAAESRFMLASYFLLVVLIGLFVVWFWQTHMLDAEPVSVLPELEQTQSVPAETPALRLESTQQPVDGLAATEVAAGQTHEQDNHASSVQTPSDITTTGTEPVPADLTAATASSQSGTQPSTAAPVVTDTTAGSAAQQQTRPPTAAEQSAGQPATSPQAEVIPSQTPVAAGTGSQATAESPGTPAVSGAEPTAGMAQLQLSFSASCWVAVIDADQQRLFYNMRSAGQQLNVSGKAPLQLTLGDPAAVQGQVNGKPLDLSAFKQGQVARLTITGSE